MPRMGRVPNENRGRNQKPVPVILQITFGILESQIRIVVLHRRQFQCHLILFGKSIKMGDQNDFDDF